jgi:hypothetical protein
MAEDLEPKATEPEYCADCNFILPGERYYDRPPHVTCRPCGAKVCDRYCLAEHKRTCTATLERKRGARLKAKAHKPFCGRRPQVG